MAELISMKQHGDVMRFHLGLKNACEGDISEEYNIYNFVVMQFRIRSELFNGVIYVQVIHAAMKKHELSKDWSTRVEVSCKALQIDKSIICSETWADCFRYKDNIRNLNVEIDIKIYITKKYSIIQKKIHEDDTHTDFQLCADDGSVAVHKVYLAVQSDMFKAMLDGQWKETAQDRVELKGVTQKTLQYFKDFMYLGTLPDEDDELFPLLLLATRYLVEDLIRGCMIRIMQTITAENLDSRMEFAVENQIDELKDNILEKIPGEIFASIYANKLNTMMDKKEPSSSSNE